jgi:hypothetical protein
MNSSLATSAHVLSAPLYVITTPLLSPNKQDSEENTSLGIKLGCVLLILNMVLDLYLLHTSRIGIQVPLFPIYGELDIDEINKPY